MADVAKLYGDLAAGALALTWAVLVLLDTRLGKALAKMIAWQPASLFGLAALSRWYATFVGFALLLVVGCAHVPTIVEGTRTAEAAVVATGMVVERLDSEDARKAEALLAEIEDLLESLQRLAPVLDAEIAAHQAEVK